MGAAGDVAPSNWGRAFLALGALSAAVSVAIGAAAEHAVNTQLATSLPLFRTAHQYHQFHALGLMIIGLALTRFSASRCLVWSGWLMIAGTLLFSGNLYLRSIFGIDQFHAVTPFGGGAFILAWLLLAVSAVAPSRDIEGANKASDR